MALTDWLRLALTEGLGPILTNRLIEAAGSVQEAAGATAALLRRVSGIGSTADAIARSMREADVDGELARCEKLGVTVICPDDSAYPVLLKSIPDPPAVLYVRGELEARDLNAMAIVGSRRCSHYGREQAERFAALLAGVGLTVVSGGARGVDSYAHRGAMSHPRGRTVAVLGCGVDVTYPPENEKLFEQIATRGTVMTEYPLGTGPLRENFPRRNRIISGMSRGVLVVEADARSGALITARQACDDHGRPVFAIPGRIDNPMTAGPHQLIRDGAVLTEKLDDILSNLGPLPHDAVVGVESPIDEVVEQATVTIALTDRQRLILSSMGDDPVHVDGLVERTALSAEHVLQELTLLTLKGAVRRSDGQTYVRGKVAAT